MLVNENGEWVSYPEGAIPQTVPFDTTRTVNPDALGDNRGCPIGYFAQYVPGTFYGTTTICRRFDQQIASNPAVLAQESGDQGLIDATVENVADASRAVVETAGALALPGMGLLALAAVAYFFLTRSK
jgi:hypothetical protein